MFCAILLLHRWKLPTDHGIGRIKIDFSILYGQGIDDELAQDLAGIVQKMLDDGVLVELGRTSAGIG